MRNPSRVEKVYLNIILKNCTFEGYLELNVIIVIFNVFRSQDATLYYFFYSVIPRKVFESFLLSIKLNVALSVLTFSNNSRAHSPWSS
jgi:hypothetical protein